MPRQNQVVGVLDNIRSLYNVGSMFRTADGLGLSHLYLCGITGTPELPKHRTRISKTSLGAEATIPWSYVSQTADAIRELKAQGFTILVLEQTPRAVSIFEIGPELHTSSFKNIAFVVGNELYGIQSDVLALTDGHTMIPMLGKKESLNVAVAFGIATAVLQNRK